MSIPSVTKVSTGSSRLARDRAIGSAAATEGRRDETTRGSKSKSPVTPAACCVFLSTRGIPTTPVRSSAAVCSRVDRVGTGTGQ
jgi:hypothetical protein